MWPKPPSHQVKSLSCHCCWNKEHHYDVRTGLEKNPWSASWYSMLILFAMWLVSYCVVCWPCAAWPLTHLFHFSFCLPTYNCQQSIQHAKSRAWLVSTAFYHTVNFSLETTSVFTQGNMVWHQHVHHRYKTKKMVFGTQLPILPLKSFTLRCCSGLVFLQWNKSKPWYSSHFYDDDLIEILTYLHP